MILDGDISSGASGLDVLMSLFGQLTVDSLTFRSSILSASSGRLISQSPSYVSEQYTFCFCRATDKPVSVLRFGAVYFLLLQGD